MRINQVLVDIVEISQKDLAPAVELIERLGVNDSTIHEDFVVGCADLEITGTTADGRIIPVFRKGEWCF